MNLREFCADGDYPHALLTTYTFSPLFFERVCLRALNQGGAGRILVLADGHEFNAALRGLSGQLLDIGIKYTVAEVWKQGAFHPKLILRLGKGGGRACVASGNLTHAGWGGNLELGAVWDFGPGTDDPGDWLGPMLFALSQQTGSTPAQEFIGDLLGLPWMTVRDGEFEAPFLHSIHGGSLAPQLGQRWAGRTFRTVKVTSGSTDREGRFLRWAHETFGVEEAIVCANLDRTQLTRAALKKLPLKTSIVEPGSNRPMHAKFAYFEGPDGDAALFGSANCSAAAWLIPGETGGNTEVVVPYDKAAPDDFASVLSLFDRDPVPESELPDRPLLELSPRADTPSLLLLGLLYDRNAGTITVELSPGVSTKARVVLHLGGSPLTLGPVDEDAVSARWMAHVGTVDVSQLREFGHVLVNTRSTSRETNRRWVDDIQVLRKGVNSFNPRDHLPEGEMTGSSREQDRILNDLSAVVRWIFDPEEFKTSKTARTDRGKRTEDRIDAPPIDPAKLVQDLAAVRGKTPATSGSGLIGRFSAEGVLGTLFLYDTFLTAADDETAQDSGKKKKMDTAPKKKGKRKEGPSKKAIERVHEMMAGYFEHLQSEEFRGQSTPSQFRQVASFAPRVGLLGTQNEWLTPDVAGQWLRRLVNTLCHRVYPGAKRRGLIAALEARHLAEGNGDLFARSAGDGTLWVVLLGALGAFRSAGVDDTLGIGITLRSVFESEELYRFGTEERLTAQIRRLQIPGADHSIRALAPEISGEVGGVEGFVRKRFDDLMEKQTGCGLRHREGDWLWSPRAGWALSTEEAPIEKETKLAAHLSGRAERCTTVPYSRFINVRQAAVQSSAIQRRLRRVKELLQVYRD